MFLHSNTELVSRAPSMDSFRRWDGIPIGFVLATSAWPSFHGLSSYPILLCSNGLQVPTTTSVKPTVPPAHYTHTHEAWRHTQPIRPHEAAALWGFLRSLPRARQPKPIREDSSWSYPHGAILKYIYVWRHWQDAPPAPCKAAVDQRLRVPCIC